MHVAALAWAFEQRPARPADHHVLLVLARHADRSTWTAFPSVAAISAVTGLNRKMVLASLGRLEWSGMIADTRHRMGRTGQIKVWRLMKEQSPIGDR